MVLAALLAGARRLRGTSGEATTAEAEACREEPCAPDVVPAEPPGTAAGPSPDLVMDERDACRDAAYLCAGLEVRDGYARALRWSTDTRLIRIRVPAPEGDPSGARAVRDAAVRGILAWNGHPFPIRIDDRDRGEPVDFVVEWTASPPGNQLGQTGTQWVREGERASLEVTSFRLSLVSPGTGQPLGPRQIELTAAHEMGHALGLPHSDAPRDVMYPTNTATTLSARDYRAMEALYRLPNGAAIRRADAR